MIYVTVWQTDTDLMTTHYMYDLSPIQLNTQVIHKVLKMLPEDGILLLKHVGAVM
jgi:hypothetical protein